MAFAPVELARLGHTAHQFHAGRWTALARCSRILMRGEVPPVALRLEAAAELRAYRSTAILPQTVTDEDMQQAGEIARIIENL